MSNLKLTKAQQLILAFTERYTEQYGSFPPMSDIASAFGFSSDNGAYCHVNALFKAGYYTKYKTSSNGTRYQHANHDVKLVKKEQEQ